MCVPENGTPLVGNTAATRPRLNLFGYDSNGDDATDSAFVVVQLEEDKGLGRALYDSRTTNGLADGTPSDAPRSQTSEKLCIAWDDGKNQWYHTFSMSLTDDRWRRHPADGLLANLTFHGHMLNQPEVNWTTGDVLRHAEHRPDAGTSATTTSISTTPRSPAAAACWRRASPAASGVAAPGCSHCRPGSRAR